MFCLCPSHTTAFQTPPAHLPGLFCDSLTLVSAKSPLGTYFKMQMPRLPPKSLEVIESGVGPGTCIFEAPPPRGFWCQRSHLIFPTSPFTHSSDTSWGPTMPRYCRGHRGDQSRPVPAFRTQVTRSTGDDGTGKRQGKMGEVPSGTKAWRCQGRFLLKEHTKCALQGN